MGFNPRPGEALTIMADRRQRPLGISAISLHQPGWELGNDWFGEAMPRKFSRHTGIESRGISLEDEVTMGVQAVRKLQRETGCDLADCRGLLFISPSFIPPGVARQHLDPIAAAAEQPGEAARQVARRLGMNGSRAVGINWFCCGYSRGLELVQQRWAPRLGLGPKETVIVVVATRISRITDYGCSQTGGLFGDMASATLIASATNRRHPVHFELVHARAERQPAERPFFNFHMRSGVPVPVPGGGRRAAAERLVYALDGMGIAETAPRAMSAAVANALAETGLSASDLRFAVPHKAGAGIVRFTGMQLDGLGFRGELVNGLTARTGNVSACSVPHALRHEWNRLTGLVACPTAAVGAPGRPEVLQGCVLLRATAHHDRQASAAA